MNECCGEGKFWLAGKENDGSVAIEVWGAVFLFLCSVFRNMWQFFFVYFFF